MNHIFKICAALLFLIQLNMPAAALTLRTASQTGAEPKFILMKDGKAKGLEIDIIKAVQKEDPGIRFTGLENFMPFKRIKLEMEKGKLDCFFGFSFTRERAEKFLFINPPLYMIEYKLVMRADDPFEPESFDDISALGKDGVILTLFGTAGTDILKEQGVPIIDDMGKTVPALLKKLELRRGRFVFYQSFSTIYAINQLGAGNRFRLTKKNFSSQGHYVAFPRATTSLDVVNRVKRALNKVRASGELNQIVTKYTTIRQD